MKAKRRVPVVEPLRDARGRVIPMEAGPCLWCGRWVEEGRRLAGATNPHDPAWHANGDFGCDETPESNSEGCGDHCRPYDVARLLLAEAGRHKQARLAAKHPAGKCPGCECGSEDCAACRATAGR